MKEIIKTVCPKCGQEYSGHPSLSRVDNQTLVCPDCGTREARESMGLPNEEIEKIIVTIHAQQVK